MIGPAPIQVVRNGTTVNKLTIAHEGRIELKLTDQVDQAGEEWLKAFAEKVVEDALQTLPHDKTLRGRFRKPKGKSYILIELYVGSYNSRKTVKCYGSEQLGLPEAPASV